MYQGFVESPERIAERKARILQGYVPPATPAPSATAEQLLQDMKQIAEQPAWTVGGDTPNQ